MATSKQAGQNKQGNILVQDNANARKGLGSAVSDPLPLLPNGRYVLR